MADSLRPMQIERRRICPRCPRCGSVMNVHSIQGRTWWSCWLCDTLARWKASEDNA